MPGDPLLRVAAALGASVPECPVCPGHTAPATFLVAWARSRPPVSLLCGPRGGGKSYLRAIATHLGSVAWRDHGTRVLGGSLSQSEQVYNALKGCHDRNRSVFAKYTRTRAEYRNGSTVSILSASPTSVRGPHVPTLCLDEVDEIDPDIRESSLGMCMELHGIPASISMTSTWHRVGGPMAGLMERGRAGEFPAWTFCAFEALERCPASRSGDRVDGPDLYERCPGCPIRPFCHADVRPAPGGGRPEPKAKRSGGHYGVESLIQKARLASRRAFEADYLCLGPRLDGLWFRGFDPSIHVSEDAEYAPHLPVALGVDSGVWTGASWFQVEGHGSPAPTVRVFADFLSESRTARENAAEVLRVTQRRCEGRVDWGYTDPAGGSRNPIGPTVLAEYEAVGLVLDPWPKPSIAESLNVIEGLIAPAAGPPRILVHPRCVDTIRAFQSYRRARRQGQWMDWPADPQHPAEDLIDALRGAAYAVLDGPDAAYGPNPTHRYRG